MPEMFEIVAALAGDSNQLNERAFRPGTYVLATKWSDGDPGDWWAVGFYDRIQNGRHYVVDNEGNQLRPGGFYRVGKITAEAGQWLLLHADILEKSPPGMINLWTMLTDNAKPCG